MKTLIAVVSSAAAWVCGMALAGVVATTSGIYLLAGIGWALVACGVFLFMGASILRMGIIRG